MYRQTIVRMFVIVLFVIIVSTGCLHAQNAECYRLVPEPAVNYVTLVIDKSGSMDGQAITDAKKGAKHFVSKMNRQDYAMVIAFNSEIQVVQEFTNNHQKLNTAIDGIRANGGTAIYNALAKAVTSLARQNSSKIIVFLTDGQDGSSRYTADNIRTMSISEGVFVYGIGLGNVDQSTLQTITNSSNGSFEITGQSSELVNIYDRVISSYYQRFGNLRSQRGAITIQSIPGGLPAYLNGVKKGNTPVKLDNINPGNYTAEVAFSAGRAQCEFPVRQGYRTITNLRESMLGRDIVISSMHPVNAVVFLDGHYVGTCENPGVINTSADWIEQLKQRPQLTIKNVPMGRHEILLRGIPEFDYGPEQEMTLNITVSDKDPATIYIFTEIMRKMLKTNAVNCKDISPEIDPFEEMEE